MMKKKAKKKVIDPWDKKIKSAKRKKNPLNRVEALCEIAEQLAKSEQQDRSIQVFKQSLATVESISDGYDKLSALSDVTRDIRFSNLQHNSAAQVIEHALDIANSVSDPQGVLEKIDTLCHIGIVLAEFGQNNRSIEIAEQALVLSDACKPFEWAKARCDIAKVLVFAGDNNRSVKICEEALDAVGKLSNENLEGELRIHVVSALAEAGQFDRALELASIDTPQYKVRALCGIVKALTEADQHDRAVQIFEQTVNEVQSISNEQHRSDVMLFVATACSTLKPKQVEQLVGKMLDVTDSFSDVFKPWALNNTILAFNKAGLHDQAIHVANSIHDEGVKARALCGIVESLARAGKKEQAIGLAEKISDANIQKLARDYIAQ